MAKILVVEDDKSLSESYALLLQKEGYEIDSAASGDEALEKAESFQPNLILLDVLMPGSTGLDFLQKYHADQHPEVKIIVFSNMDDVRMKGEAMRLGAAEYIKKALLSPAELADFIKQQLAA